LRSGGRVPRSLVWLSEQTLPAPLGAVLAGPWWRVPLARARRASRGRDPVYKPRPPTARALYEVVRDNLETLCGAIAVRVPKRRPRT
jgi:hypothetical protein